MGHFLHAVGVFFHHLAAVQWEFLGYAIACHVIKLVFRAGAWRAIINAAYPEDRLKFRYALGAYVAGVGVNSIVPARGGDVVKMYLVKQRIRDAKYTTLTPTLIVETMFDFVTAGALIVWALASGVLPTHQFYSRIPTVDWKFFLRHERFTEIALVVLLVAGVAVFFWLRRRVDDFRARVRQGFAILRDRRALPALGDPAAVDLLGVPHRVALLLPEGVRRHRLGAQRAASPRSSTRSRRCSRRRRAVPARSRG